MDAAPDTLPFMEPMTEEQFEREVLAAPLPVLVDFATSWCPPCRALAPILRQLAAERAGRLTLRTVDADASHALTVRYDVRYFPTMIAFAGGREVARAIGAMPREKLLRQLK